MKVVCRSLVYAAFTP
ncbi:hypothetical protein M2G39_22065 [Vibrio vulnificus]|nr:hypothetical protein [Vibrio vulnificus]MCG6312926.1 hypothetical protein [Vibrio vulnificus]MCU8150800.1 hypothetical protein [Vibrio vulnificus]MCU8168575.1 hypothetical protein [Vibrio vulnificus]MCU8173091.1 hypothetical protein [Vibrio vulnificus]MCU8173122.1 hypothetical protein [Vibrio vulnificus]